METKLERIAEISANSPRPEFTSLYHLINKEMLLQCHKESDGNKAVGVDEITKKEYERNLEQNIDDLVERLKRKSYKPQPSIRVYIPKSNGKLRPLGIACYEDKIVQLALKKILEAIYEPRFLNCMYGFRPNRGCHNAIKELYKRLNNTKICYIVDADIKGFFDHMKHEWIIKFLKLYIKDPNIIGLVKKYLKVGVLDNGELMLCVTNDGRKIGLDVRLMNPMLPDDPNSKLNVCVQNVLKIWEEGKDQKLTQLLFCDLSTPKNDGNFNVYDDIRKKLISAGVPENEIEFIHNADTEAKKAALFSKVRSGDVRVLLGSTAKMGAGTNVQSRLVAVHHLDVGWKPSDMTQRNGRIIRQGNMNKEVKVFNYVTEGTFDSYLFQTLENKQRFISQIMTSKSPVRSCEDVDEQALSYAEIKALCAGNPLIKEKMDLDVQVAKLKVLKADHQSQKFRLQDKLLTKFPADIRETNAYIAGVKADAQLAAAHPQGKEEFCGMTIKGVTYDEKKTAGERLVLACSELPNAEEKVIGSYRGFELSLRFDTYRSEYQALLKGQRKYTVPLGTDPLGNIIRLDNSLNNFPERINSAENELATLHQQQAAAQIEVEKPFPQEDELAEKSARLAELNAQLDVDEKSHEPEQEEEPEDEPRRPSVLAALEEKSDKPEPVKPFRSYYDKDGDAR